MGYLLIYYANIYWMMLYYSSQMTSFLLISYNITYRINTPPKYFFSQNLFWTLNSYAQMLIWHSHVVVCIHFNLIYTNQILDFSSKFVFPKVSIFSANYATIHIFNKIRKLGATLISFVSFFNPQILTSYFMRL